MKSTGKSFLSVDFDYFVREPEEWDFGHREAPFFREHIWYIRAMGLLAADIDIKAESDIDTHAMPRPEDFFEETGFDLSQVDGIYVADSHCYAYQTFWEDCDSIYNFDAHHDLGYNRDNTNLHRKKGLLDCADWLLFASKRARHTTVIFPDWKPRDEWAWPHGKMPGVSGTSWSAWPRGRGIKIDRIFICRSSSWVPPWVDDRFCLFVSLAEDLCKQKASLPWIEQEHCDPLQRRSFSWKQAREEAENQRKMLQALTKEK